MYSGSSEFNRLITTTGSGALITRLVFGSQIVTDIVSLTYNGGSNSSNELTIGSTNMAIVNASIIETSIIVANREFLLEQGEMLADGTIEYAPIGYFTVQPTKSDENKVSFKAYDRMQRFEKPFKTSLSLPTTDKALLEEMCLNCQVELATSIDNPITISEIPQGYTYREILGFIAAIHGQFACIDRYGKLNLRWYETTRIDKPLNLVYEFTKGQSNTIGKITMGVNSETVYSKGTSGNEIAVFNPFATQEIVDNVYAMLNGFTYEIAEATMLDDMRIDPWDIIRIEYFDEVNYSIPAMQIYHNMTSGSTEIVSVGKSDYEETYPVKGSLTKSVERTQTELLLANQVIATKVDAEWVNAHTVTADKLEAVYSRIGTLEADVTKTNTLIFGSATGTTIQTEFSNSVIAQLGDAQIKSAMIQDVSASKLTAGTINTSLIKIASSTGNAVFTDNTLSFHDGTRTRIQLGKDNNGDYNAYIWDSKGNVMFDALGLTEGGIQRQVIRDDVVKDNANISASKLNIESLFTVVNNDTTHTIKSNKVYLDEQGQTLDVSFKTMTTDIEGVKAAQTSQGTQLSVVQGQISSKIWQQDIDNLSIGTNNLLPGTDLFNSANNVNYVLQNGATIDNAKGCGVLSANSTTVVGLQYEIDTTVEIGKEYTFSAEIKSNTLVGGTITLFYRTQNADGTLGMETKTLPSTSTGKVKWTFTPTVSKILWFQVAANRATSGVLEIGSYQLEVGNVATNWSKSDKDLEGSINVLSTQYSTLSQDLTGFRTEVGNTYATKTSLTAVSTVATQTAEKFNWIVKNGTSASDFTLTDRMASLTAEIISLNGNVKVNGEMLIDGAVTASKINVQDLSAINATIAGWAIATDSITKKNSNGSTTKFQSDGSIVNYSATNEVNWSCQGDGSMTAKNAHFSGGSIGGATITKTSLVFGAVEVKNGEIIVSNIDIPSKPNITQVKMDSSGFRFINSDGSVERTCVWNYIYSLY